MDLSHHFAENLKEARKNAGWTQKELSSKIGYTEKAVSKWECGVGIPPAETLYRLAMLLQTSIDALFEFHQEALFFLGIDGNSSSTAFALCGSDGKILRTKTLPESNPFVCGVERCEEILEEGIREITKGIAFPQISLFAGLAGGDDPGFRNLILPFFRRFRFSGIRLAENPHNLVAAELGYDDGIAVIMDSGCNVYSQIGKTLRKYGGFGYLFGDTSSAYGIGRAAVSAVLRDEAGIGPQTQLTQLLQKKIGASVSSVLSQLYEKGLTVLSSYAEPVFLAAGAKDPTAMRILRESMQEAASLIDAAADGFPPEKESVQVVFSGRLSVYSDKLFPLIRSQMRHRDLSFRVCTREPVLGALFLAGAPIDVGREESLQSAEEVQS